MPGTIRVLMAHPQPMWRLGVKTLLAAHEGLRLVGVFTPRVLLLALDLAGAGTEALRADIHRACARAC